MIIHIAELKHVEPLEVIPWDKMQTVKPVSSNLIKFYTNQARQMAKTCLVNDGIGLAGNQVGINHEMFVIRVAANAFQAFWNASWCPTDDAEIVEATEGCLSNPNKYYLVKRPNKIKASFWSLVNKKPVLNSVIYEGLLARCYMHEQDHNLLKTIADIGIQKDNLDG
jgi:peptide deformylase